MEPATLVFVGTRTQVEAAFAAAGWSEAAPVNIHTVLRLYSAGIYHVADPTAPVTPAFLSGRPQDMAFELAVDAGSVSKRHHTRVWASGFALSDGTPIWVATASLDDRVEIKFPVLRAEPPHRAGHRPRTRLHRPEPGRDRAGEGRNEDPGRAA